ncbi:hypothetical protein LTR08_005241 [Meristemomyces frigidus]|nr:hypothetical protein LTR08_005241 [Meristemomyces frigidus]
MGSRPEHSKGEGKFAKLSALTVVLMEAGTPLLVASHPRIPETSLESQSLDAVPTNATSSATSTFGESVPNRATAKPTDGGKPKPPVVPKKPVRYYKRLSLSNTAFSDTTFSKVKSATTNDLIAHACLELPHENVAVRRRKSVDEALDVTPASRLSQGRSRAVPEGTSARTLGGRVGIVEYYASADPAPNADTDSLFLDSERVRLIVELLNDSCWQQVEPYLVGHLEMLIGKNDLLMARKVRHLLGVCASYQGETLRAIALFLSVLQTPITDLFALDAGEFAAMYWLGDCYAMLNQKREALLAYSIAERSPLFQDSTQPRLRLCVRAEQGSCHAVVSKSGLEELWNRKSLKGNPSSERSILDTGIVSNAVAKLCLSSEPGKASLECLWSVYLDGNKQRVQVLRALNISVPAPPMSLYSWTRLDAELMSERTAPWPAPYDPLFCMANVARGRLFACESDLLIALSTNLDAKIPKRIPFGFMRSDEFTCDDLTWLVRTVRQCLEMLKIEWSEVANAEGTCWDEAYSRELRNNEDDADDEGTIWFDENGAEEAILRQLDALEQQRLLRRRRDEGTGRAPSRFLDLGTGNGHLLFALREEDDEGQCWTGDLVGVDYSETSVQLAQRIALQKQTGSVRFEEWDLLSDPPGSWLNGGFDVALDKGTFDAISLMPQSENLPHPCETYREKIIPLIIPEGFLVITSCNWTKDELMDWLAPQGSGMRYHSEAKYPTYTFGGQTGQSIVTLALRRAPIAKVE